MKQRIFILFILTTCGLLYQLHAIEEVNLSKSPTESVSPDIAIDSKGRVMVVWDEIHSALVSLVDILYATKQNDIWSENDTIPMLYDASFPRLAVNSDDIFCLSCEDGKNDSVQDIFFRNYSFQDGYWSNIQRVYLSEKKSSHADTEIDTDDKVYIMWSEQYGTAGNSMIVLNSKYLGSLWPDGHINVSEDKTSLALNPDFRVKGGNVFACWDTIQNGQQRILFRERKTGNWKDPVVLDIYGNEMHPSLAIDEEENIHIISRSTDGKILYINRLNDVWNSPSMISSGFCPAGVVDLRQFKNNTLHAVWKQNSETGISIFYSRSDIKGNWIVPFKVSNGRNADNPRLEMSDNGDAHVVWEDKGPHGYTDIFYAEVSIPGEKPDAVIISSSTSGVVPCTIDFNSSILSPGNGNIISFWWSFGDGSKMEEGQSLSHIYTQAGEFLVKLYVTNNLLISGFSTKEIHILNGPFPPESIIVRKTEEGGLFFREKINALSWEEDPRNKKQGIAISFYNIYRKLTGLVDGQYERIAQVDGGVFKFADRGFLHQTERDLYSYAISATDNTGREGPKEFAVTTDSKGMG